LLLIKTDFMAGVKSTTVGFGSSAASGLMHGGAGASVGGMAIGYASSQASPKTNPFIHGMALRIKGLDK